MLAHEPRTARAMALPMGRGTPLPTTWTLPSTVNGESSRVYLQFEPASEKEIDAYHKTKNPIWSWFVRPVLGLAIVALAIIGGLRVAVSFKAGIQLAIAQFTHVFPADHEPKYFHQGAFARLGPPR